MQADRKCSRSRAIVLWAFILFLSCGAQADELQAFVHQMTVAHQFDSTGLLRLLKGAKRRQDILDTIAKPAEGLPWWRYREIFLKPDRIHAGASYWKDHEATLDRAYERFGVPPQIIVAILGVETFYGSRTGKYPVLDALYTLAFFYPKRGAFFRNELRDFLLLTREQKISPQLPKGSYAGAMGMPQFIPSSYRAYAIDFDDDGKIDIWDNDVDVIGSVANYFAVHGWHKDAPIATRVSDTAHQDDRSDTTGVKPTLTVAQLRRSGLTLDPKVPNETRTSLLRFEQRSSAEYWAGFDNFYVITRYNHSPLYALAVYQLSRAISKARQHHEHNAHRDG